MQLRYDDNAKCNNIVNEVTVTSVSILRVIELLKRAVLKGAATGFVYELRCSLIRQLIRQ